LAYHVVELLVDASDHVIDRKVIPYPYSSRNEAIDTIESIIGAFDKSGYDPAAGYWWAQSADGGRVRFMLETPSP
jgi:hypothetical protein